MVQNWERSTTRLYIVTLLIYLLCRIQHKKTGLNEKQATIKVAGRNINNLRYAGDTTLMAKKGRGTKEPLDEGEGGK